MSKETKKTSAKAPKKPEIVLAKIELPIPPNATIKHVKGMRYKAKFSEGKSPLRLLLLECICT